MSRRCRIVRPTVGTAEPLDLITFGRHIEHSIDYPSKVRGIAQQGRLSPMQGTRRLRQHANYFDSDVLEARPMLNIDPESDG